MARNYTFRIASEGWPELNAHLQEFAKTGDQAAAMVEKFVRSSPQLATGLDRAQESLEKSARGLRDAAGATQQTARGYDAIGEAARRAAAAQDAFARSQGVTLRGTGEDHQKRARDIEAYGQELDRLRAKFNPYFAAERQHKQVLEEIAEAQKVGAIAADEAAKARDRANASHRAQLDGLNGVKRASAEASEATLAVGRSSRLTANDLQNLTFQFNDVVASLGSGMAPLTILLQQGPQITQVFGGVRNTLAAAAAALGPVGLAAGAAAVGVAAVVGAAESADRRLNDLSARLRGTRSDYDALARTVDETAKKIAQTSTIGSAEARDAGAVIASSRAFGGTSAELDRLVRLSGDLARVMGQTVPEAANTLATALKRPADAARQFAEQDLRGFDDATVRAVERLDNLGKRSEAARLVFDALGRTTAGAAGQLTPLQQAFGELGNQAGRLWDGLRPILEALGRPLATAGAGLLGSLADAIEKLDQLRQRVETMPSIGDGLGLGTGIVGGAAQATRRAFNLPTLPANDNGPAGSTLINATPQQIAAAVRAEAQRAGIDPDFAARVAAQESGNRQFRPDGSLVTSSAGALGVMQLMPGTARDLGVDPKDTAQNIRGGILYLAQQLGRYGGDQTLAAAAYNAGPGRVDAVLAGRGRLPAETLGYIRATTGPDGGIFSGAAAAAGTADARVREANVRSDRSQTLRDQISQTRDALSIPGLDPEREARYNDLLREQLAALEALKDPQAQRIEAFQDQIAVLEQTEGAARKLMEAQLAEQRAAAGEGRTADVAGARQRAQQLLNAELDATLDRVAADTRAQQLLATAYAGGSEAIRETEIVLRAQNEALQFGGPLSQEAADAQNRLARAYREQAAAVADVQTARGIPQQQQELDMIRLEIELVSETAAVREREVAALRQRQAIVNRGGDPNSEVSQRAIGLTRDISDARNQAGQLRNSWEEVARFGEQAFDRIGTAITAALATGKLETLDLGNVWKAVVSEMIQTALRLAVINPVLNSVFGGNRGTLGGALAAGGMGGGMEGPAGLGGLAAGFGGFLNRPLYTSQSAYAAMAPLPEGVQGPVLTGVPQGQGITVGQGLGYAAGIGAGAYGIASGVRRGGFGGGAQAVAGGLGIASSAIGAAASTGLIASTGALAALGPYGLVAAGVLALASQFLPGQKPSNKEGNATLDLSTGGLDLGGQTGGKFSQANRDAAAGIAGQFRPLIDRIEKSLSTQVTGSLTVGVGNRDGIYSTFEGVDRRYARDEAGSKALVADLTRAMVESVRGGLGPELRAAVGAVNFNDPEAGLARLEQIGQVFTGGRLSENQRTVFNRMGVGDLDATLKELVFTRDVYEPEVRAARNAGRGNELVEALQGVYDKFSPLIDRSRALGLATDELAGAWERVTARLYEQRDRQLQGFDANLMQRLAGLGIGGDRLTAEGAVFDAKAREEIGAARLQLENLGLSAEHVAVRIAELERALGAERVNMVRQFHEAEAAERRQALQARIDQELGAIDTQLSAQTSLRQAALATAADMERAAQQISGSMKALIDDLSAGQLSGADPNSRLFSAMTRYNQAEAQARTVGTAESVGEFEAAARAYLPLLREVTGTSTRYGSETERVAAAAQEFRGTAEAVRGAADALLTQAGMGEQTAANTALTAAAIQDLATRLGWLQSTMEALVRRQGELKAA